MLQLELSRVSVSSQSRAEGGNYFKIAIVSPKSNHIYHLYYIIILYVMRIYYYYMSYESKIYLHNLHLCDELFVFI